MTKESKTQTTGRRGLASERIVTYKKRVCFINPGRENKAGQRRSRLRCGGRAARRTEGRQECGCGDVVNPRQATARHIASLSFHSLILSC